MEPSNVVNLHAWKHRELRAVLEEATYIPVGVEAVIGWLNAAPHGWSGWAADKYLSELAASRIALMLRCVGGELLGGDVLSHHDMNWWVSAVHVADRDAARFCCELNDTCHMGEQEMREYAISGGVEQ